jgi:hypothetical protein
MKDKKRIAAGVNALIAELKVQGVIFDNANIDVCKKVIADRVEEVLHKGREYCFGLFGDSAVVSCSIDDVNVVADNIGFTLSKDQARAVLEIALDNHDANFGICWDSLMTGVESVIKARKGGNNE